MPSTRGSAQPITLGSAQRPSAALRSVLSCLRGLLHVLKLSLGPRPVRNRYTTRALGAERDRVFGLHEACAVMTLALHTLVW